MDQRIEQRMVGFVEHHGKSCLTESKQLESWLMQIITQEVEKESGILLDKTEV